jgi:tyrosine-protein kinase Etk/Wzc
LSNKSLIINKDFDASIFRTILKRYWWWPLFFSLLFASFAFFFLRYNKPIYESTLVLQIGNQDNAKEILAVENVNAKTDNVSSEIELLKSQFLFEKAVERINYNVSLFSKGQILTEERYTSSSFNVKPYALLDSNLINLPIYVDFDGKKVSLKYEYNGKNFKFSGATGEHIKNQHFDVIVKANNIDCFREDADENELYFMFNSVQSFAMRMLPNLSVQELDPAAKTIQIKFQNNNPVLCHDVTLGVAEAFMEYDQQSKRKSSENILAFIDQQLDSLSMELKSSKDSLMNYQRKTNIPDPDQISTTLSTNITKLQDELFIIEDEVRSLTSVSQKLKSEPNRLDVYRLIPEMLGKSYEQSLSSQLTSLHELLEKKEDLLFSVTEGHDEVILVQSRIESKLSSIRKSINVILDRLLVSSRSLTAKIQNIEGDYYQLPEKKMEFSRLKNVQELNDKYYSLLAEKRVMYAISDAGYASDNRILSRPAVSDTPVSPNRRLIYSTFVMFGALLGLGIMFFKYLTFNEINVVDDLKNLLPTQVSILGGIPLIKTKENFSKLIVGEMPKSVLAEAMRKIRTNLSYIHPDYKTIAISSSISGEGKTFVALNLAGIIAMSGKKTIVLDLDLRKPKVHMGFDAENNFGMSGLIINQYDLNRCIQNSAIENLDFITAGPIPPNPSELLLSNRFGEIVQELKVMYDVVIIDNPPVGLVSDGIKNLSEADIPIYVFKSHYSKRVFTFRVKELFEMQKIKGLNVILNGVKAMKNNSYGYGYGYGYGYYEDNNGNEKLSWWRRPFVWLKNIFKKK